MKLEKIYITFPATVMFVQKTHILLRARISNDVSCIVTNYFQSNKCTWKSAAKAGEYETCTHMPRESLCDGFEGACRGGHKEIVDLIIMVWRKNSDLYITTHPDRKGLIELTSSIHARDLNHALYMACQNNSIEMIDYVISLGATDWNCGLTAACMNGNKELQKLMISYGAKRCAFCSGLIADHL